MLQTLCSTPLGSGSYSTAAGRCMTRPPSTPSPLQYRICCRCYCCCFVVINNPACLRVVSCCPLWILLGCHLRKQPLKETQCRLVKRLCLASLAMAGWLLGMTVIGFLVAVKGPIGAAAVAFYSDLDLDCRSSVREERTTLNARRSPESHGLMVVDVMLRRQKNNQSS